MNSAAVVFAKEWKVFLGADRGIFFLYAFLILSWSFMLITPGTTFAQSGDLWLIFFSVIVSANFTNTVFIAERINGNLEILITSGITRKAMLSGKMLFTAGMSIVIGGICCGLSFVWNHVLGDGTPLTLDSGDFLSFVLAVFFNTASGAYFSVKLANPRVLHLSNLLLLAGVVTAYSLLDSYIPLPSWSLQLVLALPAGALTLLAYRIYESEKLLQPVSW